MQQQGHEYGTAKVKPILLCFLQLIREIIS
jgi:hypothetical protein